MAKIQAFELYGNKGGAVHGYVQPSIYRTQIRAYDVETYGEYNTYPQELDYAVSRSSVAKACIDTISEFIFGDGFASEMTATSIVNDQDETLNDVLWAVAKDYAKYKGFALLCNANILGEYTSIAHFPFSYVRMGLPNERGQYTHARVWDNWASESPRVNPSFNDIYSIKLFSPSNLIADIEEAGGIENFNGHLIYFGGNASHAPYPIASFDSAMEQVLMNGNVPEKLNNYVRNNFSASAIIVNPELSSPEQQEQNARQIKSLGGMRNAGSIGYFEGAALSLLDLSNVKNLDKELPVINELNAQDIMRTFQMPSILLGSSRQGGFPNKDEMSEATKYMNARTRMDRGFIRREFERIARHFVYPIGESFEIKETNYE